LLGFRWGKKWAAGAWEQTFGRAEGHRQVDGGWVISAVALGGLAGGFKNQAGQVEGDGECVADGHGFGGVIQAEGAGTFELPASLGGVAALGIRLPADPQFPGIRTDLGITGQAGSAIWECQPGGSGISQGVVWIGKGAGGA